MSDIGNAASMKLYGIRKYKEGYYFPIKSYSGLMHQTSDAAATSTTNDSRLKHRGFTKARLTGANNAVLVEDFDTIAMGHIQQMITYADFVVPLESMNRVLNATYEDADGNKSRVRALFNEKYGV